MVFLLQCRRCHVQLCEEAAAVVTNDDTSAGQAQSEEFLEDHGTALFTIPQVRTVACTRLRSTTSAGRHLDSWLIADPVGHG
jgi:hypothetical protein